MVLLERIFVSQICLETTHTLPAFPAPPPLYWFGAATGRPSADVQHTSSDFGRADSADSADNLADPPHENNATSVKTCTPGRAAVLLAPFVGHRYTEPLFNNRVTPREQDANQSVPEALTKFGTHVKKKEHKLYGAFAKDVDMDKKATKTTFDDSDDE